MDRLLAERFALEREIGAGGMARVYKGKDLILDRPVAVKILNPGYDDTDISSRFRREGRTAASLSHPNIVQVYDAGEGELEGREVSYIVMEYVPGGDLKGAIDARGPLPSGEVARLGSEVAAGLAHAHEKGVIHRDIKPHNILIDERGRPKLTDFGIAHALDATQATRTGSYLGTARYSSPEQLQGERVTPKSDVYSLGITLYQTVVGEAPFAGTPIAVASQHINRTPTPPSLLGAHISHEVESFILDCLRKDPDRRPTAWEAYERLRTEARATRSLHDDAPQLAPSAPTDAPTVAASQSSVARRDGGNRRRRPVFLAVAALLVALLGVAAALEAPSLTAMFGNAGGEEVGQSPPETPQAGSTESTQGQEVAQQQAPESEATAPAQGETTQATQKTGSSDIAGSPSQTERTGATQTGGSGSGQVASSPSQAVEDFYASAAKKDYDNSMKLLTANWRQSAFPSRGSFNGTFDTLRQVSFVGEPEVRVSGDTATVTGETIAEHTDRTERNRGTWTLVRDSGGWIISGWTVSQIDSRPT